MKTLAAFGQGDGYGDGKVYVCLATEMKIGSFNKTNATFKTEEITKDAIEAFKYGSLENCNGEPDFTRFARPLEVFYSDKLETLLKIFKS